MPELGTLIERLKFIISKTTGGKHTLFAKYVGIPTSTFQNIVNGQFPKAEHLMLISEKCGVSIDWLLLGKGDPYLSTTAIEDIGSQGTQPSTKSPSHAVDVSDAEIIKQFSDKSYAKELNSCLVELERINPEAFKKVGSYIKGLLDGLRMISSGCKYIGPNRRVAERRVKDNPKKYKGAKDRRSGKDRRVAAQR